MDFNLIWNRRVGVFVAMVVVLGLLVSDIYLKSKTSSHETQRVCAVFSEKEQSLNHLLDSIVVQLNQVSNPITDWSLLRLFPQKDKGLEVAVVSQGRDVFWSSSSIAFPSKANLDNDQSGLVHLPSGWYYQLTRQVKEYTIHGFILIKREFPYQNRYIKNSFNADFKLAENCQVDKFKHLNALNICRADGKFLFSILPFAGSFRSDKDSDFGALLFLVFVVLILSQLKSWLEHHSGLSKVLKVCVMLIVTSVIFILVNELKLPTFFYQSKLFQPQSFAYTAWFTSFGAYLLGSILMYFFAYSTWSFRGQIDHRWRVVIKVLSFAFVAFYFSISAVLLKILVLNSTITFEFFHDLNFSSLNFFAFIALSLQLLGFVLLAWNLKAEFYMKGQRVQFVLSIIASAIAAGVLVSHLLSPISWIVFLFYGTTFIILCRFEQNYISSYKFTFLMIGSLILATYINLYTQALVHAKSERILEVQAVKLSSERDSGAEIFLAELDNKLRIDTNIRSNLSPPYKKLETYLQNNYFTGFWRNYNLQVTVCSSGDSVLVTDEKRSYPCFDFFNKLIETKGIQVAGSSFYFMDRINGRISYLGQTQFNNPKNIPVHVILELTSKVIPEGKGYPELLLDERASRENYSGDFSYAKYFDGMLVDRGGDYQYSLKFSEQIPMHQEYTHYSKNEYRHCVYQRDGNNFIVASYPEMNSFHLLSVITYLFLLFFLAGSLIIVLTSRTLSIQKNKFDLREKIQLTLLFSLLGILIVIGLSLMLYNSNTLLRSVKENLNDKLVSISSEVTIRIGQENELNTQMLDYMNDQLIVLSDIIRADINLYDIQGNLFATSRSEIYDRGLMSRHIDPVAFKALSVDHKTLFHQDESLGEMNFFSAYSPVYNQSNRLVGYLNLPYFMGQDEFKKQASDFIVAFSNLYIVLVVISLLIALVISRKLTAPLLQIENNLKGIELGKTNAKIEYSGEDEIGRLAKEYNKKVDELAESAELLARSERESAWQEMARQVAHEINNPLTPMKLSIQYLQRIKGQGSAEFDAYFNQVSKTLVEQIDALSLIASTFSDFAKMPGFNFELIDLKQRVQEIVLLFEQTNGITVTLDILSDRAIQIIADKDQLRRALINLVTNGIQAIPQDRIGRIHVELNRDTDWAFITITDNGIGISEELKDKLFEPSFTTKSSGMGLGLAIVKKIVENANGEIWFTSIPDVKTVFYLKFPLAAKA